MTADELAIQEFLKGLELFEVSRTQPQPVINKVLYNKLSGAIIQKITTEYTNTHPDLDLIDVDQTFIHCEDLLKNFYVKDGSIERRKIERFNYLEKVLEPCDQGRFTTAKNNMLFIADQGDSYEYTKN